MAAPRSINADEWQRIVAVYAKHEGRLHQTAAELGWPIARTTRLYKRGYPSIGYPPIKNILAADAFSANEIRAERQLMEGSLPPSAPVEVLSKVAPDHQRAVVISTAEEARIKEMVRREEERERARKDSLKSKAEEATLVQINRRNAIALNVMTAQVLHGAGKLSSRIQKDLEREAAQGTLSTGEKLQLIRAAASIARFNAEASVMAVKAERMVMNTPIDAGPEQPTADGDAVADAVAWIEKAQKAIGRAKERGLLTAGKKG
jgi:hypothetical protein